MDRRNLQHNRAAFKKKMTWYTLCYAQMAMNEHKSFDSLLLLQCTAIYYGLFQWHKSCIIVLSYILKAGTIILAVQRSISHEIWLRTIKDDSGEDQMIGLKLVLKPMNLVKNTTLFTQITTTASQLSKDVNEMWTTRGFHQIPLGPIRRIWKSHAK